MLQYYAFLSLARFQPTEETLSVLDGLVLRWHQTTTPVWQPSLPRVKPPIAMARGQTKLAVKLALEHLDAGMLEVALYRHINCYKKLAVEPAVAERLKELDAEAKIAGKDIWEFIVKQQLQLQDHNADIAG